MHLRCEVLKLGRPQVHLLWHWPPLVWPCCSASAIDVIAGVQLRRSHNLQLCNWTSRYHGIHQRRAAGSAIQPEAHSHAGCCVGYASLSVLGNGCQRSPGLCFFRTPDEKAQAQKYMSAAVRPPRAGYNPRRSRLLAQWRPADSPVLLNAQRRPLLRFKYKLYLTCLSPPAS